MASIFNSMPDFQSFNNSWQNSQSQNSPTPSDSSWNARSPFLQQVNYNTPTMPDVSAPTGGGNPLSAGPSGNSSGGFFSNLWSNIVNDNSDHFWNWNSAADNPITHLLSPSTDYNYAKGVLSGIGNALTGNNMNNGESLGQQAQDTAGSFLHPLQFLQHNWDMIKNIPTAIEQGFVHPQQATQSFEQGIQSDANSIPQGNLLGDTARFGLKYGIGSMNDPLMYVPLEKPLSIAGNAIKAGSDAVGLTPYVQSAVDAVKATRPVQAVTDTLGKAFVKNYGASPELSQGLQNLEGNIAGDKLSIQQQLTQLAQNHGLTPNEVTSLPEVFEGGGVTDNPKLAQVYQDLNNTLNNGVTLPDNFKIGTNAETSTMFNDKPILDPGKLIQGYYPQRYAKDLNPQLEQKMQELLLGNKKGFSTSGPFNQERQFNTVAEAEANGFNPERNAYSAIAQRLGESSKAMRTAQFLQDMLDKGVIAKEAAAGMKPSEIKPLSSFFTVLEKNPTGTSPLSQAMNESGAAFKPLTKLDDTGFSLPKELSKSAPRYRSNPLDFESPLDKAAYIVGNTTNRSARDADFIKALTQHTGLSDPELRTYGQYMRSQIRSAANGVADGEKISIPRTIGNLPEHGINPSEEVAAASDPNDFASLAKSLEQASPPDKIVKVNPYFVKPQDEAAINEFLNPSQPSGIMAGLNKLNNLYNKGFLLNPIPHMHNIGTNGMYLGGAKPEYIADAFKDIKNGAFNPWYDEAVRSGAVSGMRGSNLMQSVNQAMRKRGKLGKVVDAVNYARHDSLWDTDAAIRTALYRQAKEDGLSSAEAAAKANKFMVDYNNLTPFEKKYVKPLVPFYNWKKGNIPLQLNQMMAQTPKYVIHDHLKDAISQEISGQPTDQKGRIQTDINLPDGSHVAIDPYTPLDEPAKIADKGVIPWALGTLNPFFKEGENQLGLGSFPVKYNSQAPMDYNARQGIAHAINSLNPLGGSAMAGQIGSPSNGVNEAVNYIFDHLGGNPVNNLKTKDVPGQTSTELVTKLLGGFTARDNPQKGKLNQKYQNRSNVLDQIKYLKDTGQPVPKFMKHQAYQKVH